MKSRNQSLDLMRYCASIAVIMIHAQLFKDTNTLLNHMIPLGICRIAVPFFFILSGYLVYGKVLNNQSIVPYIKTRTKELIRFELLDIICTAPFLIFAYGIFILVRIITVGSGGTYWYMISLILSLYIMMPLFKRKNVLPALLIGTLFYLLMLSNDSYSTLLQGTMIQKVMAIHTKIWTWPQAGLCSSLMWLSIGCYIHQLKEKIHVSLPMVIITGLLYLTEVYFLQNTNPLDGNGYLMLIPFSIVFFLYLLDHPVLPFKTDILAQMSKYIYFLHHLVLNLFCMLIPRDFAFVVTFVIINIISFVIVNRNLKAR